MQRVEEAHPPLVPKASVQNCTRASSRLGKQPTDRMPTQRKRQASTAVVQSHTNTGCLYFSPITKCCATRWHHTVRLPFTLTPNHISTSSPSTVNPDCRFCFQSDRPKCSHGKYATPPPRTKQIRKRISVYHAGSTYSPMPQVPRCWTSKYDMVKKQLRQPQGPEKIPSTNHSTHYSTKA